ncbi:hypothetical protein [Polaromonas sp.]|uniref:hypothetical protein n=1 Tax=Polaromonas sp. TaxID=1869339 RepID=UPI003BB4FA99
MDIAQKAFFVLKNGNAATGDEAASLSAPYAQGRPVLNSWSNTALKADRLGTLVQQAMLLAKKMHQSCSNLKKTG